MVVQSPSLLQRLNEERQERLLVARARALSPSAYSTLVSTVATFADDKSLSSSPYLLAVEIKRSTGTSSLREVLRRRWYREWHVNVSDALWASVLRVLELLREARPLRRSTASKDAPVLSYFGSSQLTRLSSCISRHGPPSLEFPAR